MTFWHPKNQQRGNQKLIFMMERNEKNNSNGEQKQNRRNFQRFYGSEMLKRRTALRRLEEVEAARALGDELTDQ
jgi:hypothetical protein